LLFLDVALKPPFFYEKAERLNPKVGKMLGGGVAKYLYLAAGYVSHAVSKHRRAPAHFFVYAVPTFTLPRFMDANTSTPTEPEEISADLSQEEEEFSSGNRKLAIIVGSILALLVLGYVLLPAQATRRIASAMPVMELGEATVTASRPTEESKPEAEAPAATPVGKAATPAKPAATTATTAAAPATEAPAVASVEEPVAVEPVPAAPAAAEAAPATVTMSGRILDENGRPMAGATVMARGSKKVVGTDANGNYSIEVPAGENTLVYGYGGYEDQEVRTRSTQPQNVTLLPREGTRRKRR
jgi:CarboxypepD_reg-like domain